MEEPKRIAIVHEWLTGMRGGEKCLEAILSLFPNADLYTLLHVKGAVSAAIERMPIRTSFIQHLPFSRTAYRYFLPLFPTAIERFALEDYDLVISSHHCVAKGVRTGPETLHICYCHTPMRYIWDMYDEYFGTQRAGIITRTGAKLFLNSLRRWDVRTASNPHYFMTNSNHVRKRIQQIYHRDADVLYGPVDVRSFRLSSSDDGYFLVAGALVPYKRVEVAIKAFNTTGQRLVIAGEGPESKRLRSMAKANVVFVGWQTDDELRSLYAGCRALVFPGQEDFGLVPLEAMASGKPVIAYGKGGALETVVDGVTGLFFSEQSTESIMDALRRFGSHRFDPAALRMHAMKFDREGFVNRLKEYIQKHWEVFKGI